jgi:tRNA(Ile)-lysidine synthase
LLTAASQTELLTLAEFDACLASLARFEPSPLLAVAVSGGSDSLALALLADRWSRERGGEICALTVDHGLRPESGIEAHTVHAWLSARSIRHEVLTWVGEKPRTGIQAAARIARYRLLSGWCRENGCLHLLTAHHREDQIETHLIRRRARSGPDGLAGMSAIREFVDCRLLRPLLGVPSARLRALLEAERQPFVSDPSNLDRTYERSRLRTAENGMPGAADRPALAETIRALGFARAALQREVDSTLGRFVTTHPAGFAVLDPAIMEAVTPAVAERALSAVVAMIGGRPYPPGRDQIVRLREVLGSGRQRGHLLGGCHFVRWRRSVLALRELARAAEPVRLTPGESVTWDRYRVSLAATAAQPFVIGYLGSCGAAHLDRLRPRPKAAILPRLLFPILPACWDEEGIAAVPYLGFRRAGIGTLPRFVLHACNPLTQAGFAVV